MMHRIELVETRRGCAMFETKPRYDVKLNGVVVEQLYFNMRGYVGNLPLPGGSWLGLPESGISNYRKEASKINREAKEIEP